MFSFGLLFLLLNLVRIYSRVKKRSIEQTKKSSIFEWQSKTDQFIKTRRILPQYCQNSYIESLLKATLLRTEFRRHIVSWSLQWQIFFRSSKRAVPYINHKNSKKWPFNLFICSVKQLSQENICRCSSSEKFRSFFRNITMIVAC